MLLVETMEEEITIYYFCLTANRYR